mmetsp:Transcript_34626/g.87023  ORF Transcript_34626/g.87023 Transcript_34626/m.87023 type:complete len:258 (+) Transcript_34626:2548-3321(+)
MLVWKRYGGHPSCENGGRGHTQLRSAGCPFTGRGLIRPLVATSVHVFVHHTRDSHILNEWELCPSGLLHNISGPAGCRFQSVCKNAADLSLVCFNGQVDRGWIFLPFCLWDQVLPACPVAEFHILKLSARNDLNGNVRLARVDRGGKDPVSRRAHGGAGRARGQLNIEVTGAQRHVIGCVFNIVGILIQKREDSQESRRVYKSINRGRSHSRPHSDAVCCHPRIGGVRGPGVLCSRRGIRVGGGEGDLHLVRPGVDF